MACTFLAIDERNAQRIALKIPLPNQVQSLTREQQATADVIGHENVIFFDFAGSVTATNGNSYPFICMEYVPGRTLRQKLDVWTDGLPQIEVVRLGIEMCSAIKHIHDAGFVHRDYKPSNVILAALQGERARVVDFGLACCLDQLSHGHAHSDFAGTFIYAAPERLADPGQHATSKRADLFSFGCVLFELLTGHAAFQIDQALLASNPNACLQKLIDSMKSVNPVQFLGRGCHPRLRQLIWALLKSVPNDRPSSADEVLNQLRQISMEDLIESDLTGHNWPCIPSDLTEKIREIASVGFDIPELWCSRASGCVLGVNRERQLLRASYEMVYQTADTLLNLMADIERKDPEETRRAVTDTIEVLAERRSLLVKYKDAIPYNAAHRLLVGRAASVLNIGKRLLASELSSTGNSGSGSLEKNVFRVTISLLKIEPRFIREHAVLNDLLLATIFHAERRL